VFAFARPRLRLGEHVKKVAGRKTDMTDMTDAQWLAALHAHGLLRLSFIPPKQIFSGISPRTRAMPSSRSNKG